MPAADRMPTAGRLVAAICLGVLAWVGSEMIRDMMPPETAFGRFNYINTAIGVACGWVTVGRRLGRPGLAEAISIGLTGLGAVVFWALVLHSLREMLSRSLARRYTDPFEALNGMFEIALRYASYMLDGTFIGVLLGGGILTGLLAQAAMRRWG